MLTHIFFTLNLNIIIVIVVVDSGGVRVLYFMVQCVLIKIAT